MKKRNKNKIIKFLLFMFLPLFIFPFSSCSFAIDYEIEHHDDNAFFNCINDISQSKCPTIYLTSNSIQIQSEMALIYIAASELSINKSPINSINFDLANQIMFVDYSIYQYKTKTRKNNKIYDFSSLLGFGRRENEYKDILKYGIDKADHMILTNLEDFDTSKSSYSSKASEYGYSYSNPTNTKKMLEQLVSLYSKKTKNCLFNFVVSDYLYDDFDQIITNQYYLELQTYIYSIANKIYYLGDKESSYSQDRDLYVKNYNKYGYFNAETQRRIWNIYHNTKLSFAYKTKIFERFPTALLNNETYSVFLNIAPDWWKSTYNTYENINLISKTWTKYAYFDFNWSNYALLFGISSRIYNELDISVKNFFNFNNGILDYVNMGKMDKNKKNILIPSDLLLFGQDDQLDKFQLSIFDDLIMNYPMQKYNYIFKSITNIDQDIFNKKVAHIFKGDYVILDNCVPLEYLVSLDWNLVQLKKQTDYYIIDPTSYVNNANCIISGYDFNNYIPEAIYSLIANFQSNYLSSINHNKWVSKLFDASALYIPSNFDISNKEYSNYSYGKNQDYYASNLKHVENMFSQFTLINTFINIELIKKI